MRITGIVLGWDMADAEDHWDGIWQMRRTIRMGYEDVEDHWDGIWQMRRTIGIEYGRCGGPLGWDMADAEDHWDGI